jgi:hypothetical protein
MGFYYIQSNRILKIIPWIWHAYEWYTTFDDALNSIIRLDSRYKSRSYYSTTYWKFDK